MGCVITSPLLVMALVFGYFAWRRWHYAAALEAGRETEGRVVALTTDSVHFNRTGIDGVRERRSYRVPVPVVEFNDASGALVRLTNPEGVVGRHYRVGDRVKVRFPADAPEQAVVVGEQNYAIAAAIGAVALACLFSWLRLNC